MGLTLCWWENITIGCTATDSPPLRGFRPAREAGVMHQENLNGRSWPKAAGLPTTVRPATRVLVLSPDEPAFYGLGTVLLFPRLQCLLVTAAGLDDFASVRVLVDLQLALGAAGARGAGGLGGGRLWVQQLDDVGS